jgi:prefoldin subunit 5
MFDYIFKTFIQVLDECINQREKELHEKKEEWVYFSEKRCNNLESEAQTMMKQIAKLRVSHKEDCAKYE